MVGRSLLYFPSLLISCLLLAAPVFGVDLSPSQLEDVTRELAARLDDELSHPITDVAVYFFRPADMAEGANLTGEQRRVCRCIERAVEQALVMERGNFQNVITRDFKRWKKILDEEYNHGILNANTIADVGHGLGAKYVVTGEFVMRPHGGLEIEARIFDPLTGRNLAVASVDDSYLSTHYTRIKRAGLWGIIVLFLAAAGLLLFQGYRKSRLRGLERGLAEALASRDIPRLRRLSSAFLYSALPESMRAEAAALLQEKRGVLLRRGGETLGRFGTPPLQPFGRGEWPLKVVEPRFSRAPQAWIGVEGGRFVLEHNSKAKAPTLVNGSPVTRQVLGDGDVITAGNSNGFRCRIGPHGEFLELQGEYEGEERLIFIRTEAPVSPRGEHHLVFKEGVLYIRAGHSLRVEAPRWGRSWTLEPGGELALCHGDMVAGEVEVERLQ